MEIVSELFNIMTKVFLLVLRKEWMLSLYIYMHIYIYSIHGAYMGIIFICESAGG